MIGVVWLVAVSRFSRIISSTHVFIPLLGRRGWSVAAQAAHFRLRVSDQIGRLYWDVGSPLYYCLLMHHCVFLFLSFLFLVFLPSRDEAQVAGKILQLVGQRGSLPAMVVRTFVHAIPSFSYPKINGRSSMLPASCEA